MYSNSQQSAGHFISNAANAFLDALAKELEIPDSAYDEAESRYKSVGQWLCRDASTLKHVSPVVHIQGSFGLGTVVRPVNDDEEYDIDMMAELHINTSVHTQKQLKEALTYELDAYSRAHNMKRVEPKRRCTRLIYADTAQFHIDVTPAVPNGRARKAILKSIGLENSWIESSVGITDEQHPTFAVVNPNWPNSNPRGYLKWFHSRMASVFEQRKKAMAISGRKSVEEIPDYKVKTPLQVAVQILKRHRDMTHEGEPADRPISIIITTLAGLSYNGETTIGAALYEILNGMERHITRKGDQIVIMNPTDPQENFADKWKDHPEREKAFFDWLAKAKDHFFQISNLGDIRTIGENLSPLLGAKVVERAVNAGLAVLPTGVAKLWSLGNPTHKQDLLWPKNIQGSVAITQATYLRRGFRWQEYKSGGNAIPKHASIEFVATTNVAEPYEIWWQVVNTGDDARRAGGLRGNFNEGTVNRGKLERKESTLYRGSHTIECFIIKGGYCVASSGPFIVNIQ